MKKRNLNQGKKLTLKKLIVTDLGTGSRLILGGGDSQEATCLYNMCQDTQRMSCRTNCVSVDGLTCTPDTICRDTGVTCISCVPGTGCPTQDGCNTTISG